MQFLTDAIPSGTTNLVLSVTAPDGTDLGTIDTGSSPEALSTTLQQRGTYTISDVDRATSDFTVDVRPILSPSRVSTDSNLLFFGPDGKFLASSSDNNPLSGRPSEVVGLPAIPRIQVVTRCRRPSSGTPQPGVQPVSRPSTRSGRSSLSRTPPRVATDPRFFALRYTGPSSASSTRLSPDGRVPDRGRAVRHVQGRHPGLAPHGSEDHDHPVPGHRARRGGAS